MTCFFLFFFHNWEIFFFFIHDTMYCAKWICAHTGSIMLLRTCKLLSIQQSKKRCFPVSLSSSSSWNIICHSDLHLQARNSFFECGLFPSRASISVMVWGVIWDKICKEEGRTAISLKLYCTQSSISVGWNNYGSVCQAQLLMWEEKRKEILPGGHPGSQVAGPH